MKLTKLTILAATAAFVLNASAKLPSGYESVVFKATVLTENGGKVKQTKITTDDILSLIDNEYGTAYAKQDGGNGYQLVSYGVGYDLGGDDIFAVMDKNGNIVLADASFDADDYYLYLYPYESDFWVESYKGENYNYTVPQVEVYYNSSDDEDSFFITGLMTDKVNWTSYNESYSLKNGQGSIDFNDEEIYGPIMNASVSGSGKDVDPYDD
jgi:hypothetical protein